MRDFFSKPESVAEQKERLRHESERRRIAEAIARRLAAPIGGRPVDTTGDLFDQAAAEAPLFATLSPEQKQLTMRKRLR